MTIAPYINPVTTGVLCITGHNIYIANRSNLDVVLFMPNIIYFLNHVRYSVYIITVLSSFAINAAAIFHMGILLSNNSSLEQVDHYHVLLYIIQD